MLLPHCPYPALTAGAEYPVYLAESSHPVAVVNREVEVRQLCCVGTERQVLSDAANHRDSGVLVGDPGHGSRWVDDNRRCPRFRPNGGVVTLAAADIDGHISRPQLGRLGSPLRATKRRRRGRAMLIPCGQILEINPHDDAPLVRWPGSTRH